jgi:hypothetical protein
MPEGEAIHERPPPEASMLVRLNGVEAPVIEKTFGPPGSLFSARLFAYARARACRLCGARKVPARRRPIPASRAALPSIGGWHAHPVAQFGGRGISKPVRLYAFALLPELDRDGRHQRADDGRPECG